MAVTINLLRWILRIAFLLALAFGIALWTGHAYEQLRLHMWLGFILTFGLLALIVVALFARVGFALPIIALLWAVSLPTLGIAQLRLLPGANHWMIRVVHLILGVGAVGLGESLAKRALISQRSDPA